MFDEIFCETALRLSQMSHCVRHKVACLFVKDGRIIATGINGTPKGYPENCDDIFKTPEYSGDEHKEWSELHEVHAEANGIAYAAKHGISLNESTAYCTLRPCMSCTKLLISAGVKEIVYVHEYDRYPPETARAIDVFIAESGVKIRNFNNG
jgi:dCMP deaminase